MYFFFPVFSTSAFLSMYISKQTQKKKKSKAKVVSHFPDTCFILPRNVYQKSPFKGEGKGGHQQRRAQLRQSRADSSHCTTQRGKAEHLKSWKWLSK